MTEAVTPLVEETAQNTTLIDLLDRNLKGRTSGYLLEGDELAIIEAGPGPSGELWLKLLASKGYSPADVSYVIVTHLHLDHAGAAGYLLQKCEKARLVVHPRGARFLVNPLPLVEGSRDFFVDFEKTMLPVYPAAEERIIQVQDGETIDCGSRKLTFFHGDGHSRSHFTVLDSMTNGVFCGDAAGLVYLELKKMKIDFCIPATVPNQFDPAAYRLSLEKIKKNNPEVAFYTHFGAVTEPGLYFDICLEMLDMHVQAAEETLSSTNDPSWQDLARLLEERVRGYLTRKGYKKDQPLPPLLALDIKVNAQGLADWWSRKQQGK
ncbi:MAG: MBL fold metallo-hydrolase [Peptococcaceae bacterium]|jgi:glyoxylase-like metal-dependent hydrolase (beta-lactamase superfamily II)|nr:MBL fold metallo-hydrolase [Peptococcaceae bacterium]MDH7523837.1 MBL fold metallo-hydrolase [Peptococcaceae bacterium]